MPDHADTRFDRDTRVVRIQDGEFEARIDPGWWILSGPNGGYVAAIVLRAMEAAVGDAERAPRSLTIHFTAPPAQGPARIETRIERTGRSLTTVTARMWQGERILHYEQVQPEPVDEFHELAVENTPQVMDRLRCLG